ncbi:MAG: hypothetical protein R3B06_10020 [Kofleriaceae bacterium]
MSALPARRSRRPGVRSATPSKAAASVEPPSARSTGWLVVAGAAAVVGVVVAVAVTRGGRRSPPAPAPDLAAAPAPVEIRDPSADVAPPAPSAPARPDPRPVVDQLERALAGQRLYAKTSIRGDQVELRSSFCDDAALVTIVASFGAALAAEGVGSVRCVELHGAEVFVRAL